MVEIHQHFDYTHEYQLVRTREDVITKLWLKKCQNSHMEASWERCELLHQGRCPIKKKNWLPSNRPTNFGCQATDQQTYLKARQNGNMYLNSYLEYNLPKMFLWREPE